MNDNQCLQCHQPAKLCGCTFPDLVGALNSAGMWPQDTLPQIAPAPECPPMPLFTRWINADKLHLLQHAQHLEENMRLLAALLEGRDLVEQGGPTPTSAAAIAASKRLARLEP